ncbi:hypothetical protein [Tsukamurella sputi]|uniref:hypothetical protein n=1 Tax=Tsukamurella sputi TaxID=2591848 RepID=UPI0013159CF8|nr:hypothetical protein [Tsukamurella sputi]
MDDWDQLTNLGDCGAIRETYIPGVSIRWVTAGEYIIPARVARRYANGLLARLNAAA